MEVCGIPSIAFGTGTAWFRGYNHNFEGDLDTDLIQTIELALHEGFTHLDLAEMYGNDREVSAALENFFHNSGKSRDSLFITSKAWQSYDDLEAGCRKMLSRLGCTYFDLYLLHAPVIATPPSGSGKSNLQLWKEMEKLIELNLVRKIGLSNFRGSDVREIMEGGPKVSPVVNQVEFHPYLQQPVLREVCRGYGIGMAAYKALSPLTKNRGGPLDGLLVAMAERHGVAESTVLQWYTQQRGYVFVTTSRKVERMREYLGNAGKGGLSEEEMKEIEVEGEKYFKRCSWDKVLHGDAGLE